MKINFAQLEVYTDIQKTNKICMDARQQLGELIYEVGSGIKAHSYCKPAIIDAINALKTE